MIKIQAGPGALAAAVGRLSGTWTRRAAAATAANVNAGKHLKDHDGIWSAIKAAFVDLQHRKCAYCERQLGASGIEWDVEHFRPKSLVQAWVPASGAPVDNGGASTIGYFWLAFDLANYLVSCKPCNTLYKKSFFPTAAARQLGTSNAAALRTEEPYLINPIDAGDTDPQQLIAFDGLIPVPALPAGRGRQRALVTIELLRLAREDLIRERAQVIGEVYTAHRLLTSAHPADQDLARQTLDRVCSATGRHSSCAGAFLKLCTDDPAEAHNLALQAVRLR